MCSIFLRNQCSSPNLALNNTLRQQCNHSNLIHSFLNRQCNHSTTLCKLR
jgi:hypothetical protein